MEEEEEEEEEGANGRRRDGGGNAGDFLLPVNSTERKGILMNFHSLPPFPNFSRTLQKKKPAHI